MDWTKLGSATGVWVQKVPIFGWSMFESLTASLEKLAPVLRVTKQPPERPGSDERRTRAPPQGNSTPSAYPAPMPGGPLSSITRKARQWYDDFLYVSQQARKNADTCGMQGMRLNRCLLLQFQRKEILP